MATLLITNTTAPAVPIADVGVTIPAGIGSSDSFTDPRLIRDLAMSASLRTLVTAGTLTLSDGTNALVNDDLAAFWAAGGQTLPKGTTPISTGPGYKSQPPGTDGTVLAFDSSQPSGVKANTLPFGMGANRTRWWMIQQNAGLTTLNNAGFTTAPTATGTATVLNTTVAQFIQYVSAAVLNSDAGWIAAAFSQTQFNYRPVYTVVMRTDAVITLSRIWMGLFSATPMAAADPAISGMGFRYDTSVDGTAFWRCWTNDAAGAGTVTVTTVALVASTIYRLRIEVDPAGANVKFYINGALVATHTTDLPVAATNLGHVEEVRTLDATPLARTIALSKVQIEQVAG